MEISLGEFPDLRGAFHDEEGQVHEDPLGQYAGGGYDQGHARRPEQCIGSGLHVPSSVGLGGQSPCSDTQETEVPVQQVEQKSTYRDASNQHRRIPVKMACHGKVHHAHDGNGDIGEYARDSEPEYFSVQRGHPVLSEFPVFLNHAEV